MSDLESLSNAELRAKCIELALPNIPVTDTSRNVIIKRLRLALGGVSSPAAKKTTRRETIAVTERSSPAKSLLVSSEKVVDVNAASNRVDKRRTVATAGTEVATNTITERRASMTAERRAPKSNLGGIKEQSRRTPTMVVLDSDEEDEVLAAVQKAEQQQQPATNTRRSSSRQPSLSRTTTTVTTEFKGLSAVTEESPSLLEKMRAEGVELFEQQKRRRQQEQLRAKQEQREQMLLKQQQEEKERLINQQRIQKQLEDARSRYNAANRKPVQLSAYEPAQKAPQLESGPRGVIYKPTASLYPQLENIERTSAYTYNEFSDDTDADVSKGVGVDSDEEKLHTPFLSEFARNLNRLKAEPLLGGGDLSRRYTRSRTAHEVKGRVAMPRYGHEQGQATFWQNLVYLNNRYNLLRHLFLVAVIVLVVYIFMNFWQ